MDDRAAQLAEALAEALRRVRLIRYDGASPDGAPAFTDAAAADGGTGTSFRLEPGETLGAAIDRIDQRFQQRQAGVEAQP